MSFLWQPRYRSKNSYFDKDILEASCTNELMKSVGLGLAAGGFFGASLGFWFKESLRSSLVQAANKGALGAGLFGIYYGTMCSVAQFRHKDDAWNASVGGLVTGAVFGMRAGSVPSIVGNAAFLGVASLLVVSVSNEIRALSVLSQNERMEKRSEAGHFAIPRLDPYAARTAKLQAAEESKS